MLELGTFGSVRGCQATGISTVILDWQESRSPGHALCSFVPGSILAHRSSRSTLGRVQICATGSIAATHEGLNAGPRVTPARVGNWGRHDSRKGTRHSRPVGGRSD